MSEPQVFVIRRGFVAALGLLVVLTLVLLGVCVAQGQPLAKAVILAFLLLPLLALLIESARRRLVVDQHGVTAFRLFRLRRIAFSQVTGLEAIKVRSRIFLTLMAGDDDFLIITNSYAGFGTLLDTLLQQVPAGCVSPEARALIGTRLERHADLVTAWLAVFAVVYILVAQFR